MDELQLRQVVYKAFRCGEAWALTYNTWFDPSAVDTEEEMENAVEACRLFLEVKEDN